MWKSLLLSLAKAAAERAGGYIVSKIPDGTPKSEPSTPEPPARRPKVRRRSLAELLADSDAALAQLLATNIDNPIDAGRILTKVQVERRRNQELRARIEAKLAEAQPSFNDPSLQG